MHFSLFRAYSGTNLFKQGGDIKGGQCGSVAQLAEFVVVALLFYVHGKHLRSCRDGQLT